MRMTELTLYVAGMSCRRCVREVTARLRDVAGVETVAADADRSHVRLSGSMTYRDVVSALAGTAYRAVLAQDLVQGTAPDTGQDRVLGDLENSDETEPGQGSK